MTTTLRPARMELKTSEAMKELLVKAASLDGLDLTAFVLGPAIEKARQVLSAHANIELSKKGQLALIQALQKPGKPTTAMKELMTSPVFEKLDA